LNVLPDLLPGGRQGSGIILKGFKMADYEILTFVIMTFIIKNAEIKG
jgi:hypothetical protein